MSGIFTAIDISSTGLTLQRKKMDAVSQNIANVDTTRTPDGGPYKRQRVMVSAEDAPKFSSEMRRANDKLVRTNPQHLNGYSRANRDNPGYAEVSGETVADPASGVKLIYDPSHPDANEDGYVQMPDIEMVNEMVDMIAANRAYEANLAAVSSSKRMLNEALDI